MGSMTTVFAMKNAVARLFGAGMLVLLFAHIFRGFIKASICVGNVLILGPNSFHLFTKSHKLEDGMVYWIDIV